MMKKCLTALLFLSVLAPSVFAQADRREVRAGNRKFARERFKEAEIDYRRAVLKDSLSVAGQYDLASALYRQQDWEGAQKALDAVKETAPAGPYASDWHYNRGDVALQKKDYAAAAEAFKQALLLDPGDMDAKENYIYAKLMMQRQGGGDGQDRNQDQDQQDQNQDQNKDQDQQQQDQQQNQQDQQDQKQADQDQQNPDRQLSRQQEQQMLRAIQAKEKETQDKVKKEKAALLQSRQKEKNW